MRKAIRVLYWALVLAGAGMASLGCSGESTARTPAPTAIEPVAQPPVLVTVATKTTLDTRTTETRGATATLDAIEARLPTTGTTTGTTKTTTAQSDGARALATVAEELTMTAEASTGFTIARLVVATGVSEREPVGGASSFSAADTTRLWAFIDVDNPAALPGKLQVTWLETISGRELHPYTLEVQGHKRWRTWARAAAPKQPGAWEVIVRDEAGVELARTPFEMVN